MKRCREKFEIGARVRTVRACAHCFAKSQPGTVAESSCDGHYRIRFDQGSAWWLHESEFERVPARRRRVALIEQLALAWHRVKQGTRS